MNDLAARLEAARDEVARLETMMRSAPCLEVGHRWYSYGGANAGCGEGCGCSVPVNMCAVCGDCDYGDNEEAAKTREECGGVEP